MATIKRIQASNEAIEKAKKTAFTASYGFSDGQIIVIQEIGYTSHSVDGINKGTAVPIITLQGLDEVIYLRSLLKERFDYQGKIQSTTGTFNIEVQKLSGKTIGEVVDYLNSSYKGKSLKAIRKNYMGINRNGEIQQISYNEFDLN